MSKITVTTIAGLTSGGDANTVKIESGDAFNVVSGATTLGGAATISGDLIVDTDLLKVDASANTIGIGKSGTTGGKVEIASNAAATTALFISNNQNTAGTYSDLRFAFAQNDLSYSSGLRFRQVDTSHGGQLEFYTDNASGTFTKQMTITENGHVLKTSIPAFHVYSPNNSNSSGGISSAGTLTWGGTHINAGSHFNVNNGKFTAPVAGTYYFSASLLYDDSYNNVGSAYWRKNGSGGVNGSYGYVDGNAAPYLQVSFDAIVSLAASDTMELYSSIPGWHVGGESSCLGYLLG